MDLSVFEDELESKGFDYQMTRGPFRIYENATEDIVIFPSTDGEVESCYVEKIRRDIAQIERKRKQT